MSVNVDPLWGMASSFIETQFMLVHGGSPGRNVPPVGRTFALKLDTNWNTSQPDIEVLHDDFQGFNFASTFSSDNKTWFMMANSIPHKFNTGNGTWSQDPSYPYFTAKGGLGAATDPVTGLIYVINGFSTNGSYSLLQYNLATGASSSLPMEPTMVTLSDSAVVWSTVRKSMFVHGGWRSSPPSLLQGLYEFVPDGGNGTWTFLSDKGDRPQPRRAHCLVPAYGGSKMILFGGLLGSGERAASDIYLLDVKTLTWSKLTDPGELYARAYHACAVSNDMFVSWGGSDSTYSVTNTNVTLVYNLKKNVWQDTFSPQPQEDEPVPPNSSLSLAAIIGIVAGIIVIVLVVGYVAYRRKQRQCEPAAVSCTDGVDADHTLGGGYKNSAETSIKKESFQPFKSLKSWSTDGKETGNLMEAVRVQHKQEPLYLRDSMLSHNSIDAPAIAHQKHFYVAPVSTIGGDLEGDDAMYRPSEIILRGPQAIIDTSGYQDCKSTARGPQTIQ